MAIKATVTKPRRGRNSKVAARTIKHTSPKSVPFDEDPVDRVDEKQSQRLEAKVDRKQALTSVPEVLAGHKFYYKNWLWDQDKKHFPFLPRMRHVDLYYPEAIGGPLLIDFPMKEAHAEDLRKDKEPLLLKAGYRYICLSQTVGIDEAWELLGRVDFKMKDKK